MEKRKESARVVGCLGGRYEVLTAEGDTFFCRARGHFRHADTRVLVGDRVTLEEPSHKEGENTAVICSVAPRKNQLIRPLMANLDHLVAVAACTSPEPMPELLDKLLAVCAYQHIDATLVFTKTDLHEQEPSLAEIYRRAGYPVFCLSGVTGEGTAAFAHHLDELLAARQCVSFAGASGVGKSTLLNALFPALSQVTGAISEKIARGRHTTRSVSLFATGGGFVADTPGFSLLDFLRFDFFSLEDLPHTFPEVEARLGQCRYADCSHTKEEECAVRRDVASGDIARTRYESYCHLYEILREKKRDAYK